MKKIITIVCMLILSLGLFGHTANAASVSFDENGNMIIDDSAPTTAEWTYFWIAYPTDYEGDILVRLHSTEQPEGVPLFELTEHSFRGVAEYSFEEWSYVYYRIADLIPSTYWVTLESDYEEYGGKGFPDTKFRSILPNIDTDCTKVDIQADSEWGTPGARLYNIQQFFCIYSEKKSLDENVSQMETIFTDLLKNYVKDFTEGAVSHSLNIPVSGHYDDYITLYQPYGYGLYEFFSQTDSPMHSLIEGFHTGNAYVFNKDSDEYLRGTCAENVLFQGILFGWDIVFDTRNLEYNSHTEGWCSTDFCLTPYGEKKNIFFRNLGDDIPEMKKVTFIDINDKEELLKFMGEQKLQSGGQEYVIDGLDELIEVNYDKKTINNVSESEDSPNWVPTDSQIPTEAAPSWYKFVPLAIIGIGAAAVGVTVIFSKRKIKKR